MKRAIIKNTIVVTSIAILIVFISSMILLDFTNRKSAENNVIKLTELLRYQYLKNSEISIPNNFSTEIRVSLIEKNGKVIYDNMEYSDNMGNHIERPEIINAFENTPKVVFRYSTTLKTKMIYYALKVDDNMVIRVAVPLDSVNNFKAGNTIILVLTLILTFTITLIATNRLTQLVTSPLKSIDKQLKKVSQGQFGRLDSSKYVEINQIIDGVNDISAELSTTMMSLEAEKDKLYFVLDNMKEGLIAIDSNDEIAIINRYAREVFQVSNTILSRNLKYLTNNLELIENFYYHGEEKTFKISILEKSYFCRIARLSEQGLMLLLMADITEEVNIANTKARFFDNASHELKTPITSIKGFVELLGKKDISEAQTVKYIDIIDNNVDRLLAIIEDMMALSKLENNSKKLIKEKIELFSFIKEIIDNIKSNAIINNIEVMLNGNGEVLFDKSELSEMLTNLIENAVKYNKPNGYVKIFIEENKVIISDNGIGIENKNLDKIFERFYRVDTGRSRKFGGTGLGLAIVKHIALRNKVNIAVNSTLGVGTDFILNFSKE